jgi:hypothetical protein
VPSTHQLRTINSAMYAPHAQLVKPQSTWVPPPLKSATNPAHNHTIASRTHRTTLACNHHAPLATYINLHSRRNGGVPDQVPSSFCSIMPVFCSVTIGSEASAIKEACTKWDIVVERVIQNCTLASQRSNALATASCSAAKELAASYRRWDQCLHTTLEHHRQGKQCKLSVSQPLQRAKPTPSVQCLLPSTFGVFESKQ